MFSDLIIGFDGSDGAREALALARRLVLDTGARPAVVVPGAIGYVNLTDARRGCATEALDRAARAAHAGAAGITVERRPAAGAVARAVTKLSDGADLLMIGSRGYGALRRVLCGTHTGRILHAASIPVLVLPDARTKSSTRRSRRWPPAASVSVRQCASTT